MFKNIIQIAGVIELEEALMLVERGVDYIGFPLRLKELNPQVFIIKSLIIKNDNYDELTELINDTKNLADAFMTDTYDPETERSGATGKTHDWVISKKIVDLSSRPVILAGGLNPENVREAILKVKPEGVDSHSGVEAINGRKDLELVKKFVNEAKRGFNKTDKLKFNKYQ